jgi:hypothetical protein
MKSSLENLLVEWSLANGPIRSHQEIVQVRRIVARIVEKYFGIPALIGPNVIFPANQAAAD